MHLLDLPEEILLEIVSFSKAEDALELVKTCRVLHHLTSTKTFWIHLVNHTSRRRPVPLPFSGKGTPLQISNEQYRRAVFTTLKLEAKWTRAETHTNPISSGVYRTPDYQPSQFANHRQIWVLPLSDGMHFVSMSIEYYLRLWNISTGEIEQTIHVGGLPLCWDYYLDNEGVTLIANLHEDLDTFDEKVFKVWRHIWEDKSCPLKVRQKLRGDIRSNFIEREHAGCVGIAGPTCFIYLVDWRTGDSVYIITPLNVPYSLSAATSPTELALYMESTMHADYYAYSFDTMTKYYATPMAHSELGPDVHIPQVWIDQGVPDHHNCLPTTRYLWDGRHAVFSRANHPDENDTTRHLVLFGIVQSEPSPDGEPLPPNRRLYIHEVSEIGIVQSPQAWDLCGMGTAGRSVVWAKPPPGADEDDFLIDTICIAQFPTPEEIEKEESWVSGPSHWQAVEPIVIELEHSVNWDEMNTLFDDEGYRVASPMETDDEAAVTASEGEEFDFFVASDVTPRPQESTQDTATYPPLLPPRSSPLSASSLLDFSGVSVGGSSSGIAHSDEDRDPPSPPSRLTPSQSSHSPLSWRSDSDSSWPSASSVSSSAVNQSFEMTPSELAASPTTTSSILGSADTQPSFVDADEGSHHPLGRFPSLEPSSASRSRFSESVTSRKPRHKPNSVVEFKLPEWVYAEHGDVYSLDLDDQNGRLFLAMADGSVVMLSFV